LLASLCISGSAVAKELSELFEVKISSDQYTNTNDGLNKAFNRLILKLSGSRDPKLLWKIGNTKLKKIDYVSSYSIIQEDGLQQLVVRFNDETLIPALMEINLPLIGYNRPVILLLINLDAGESEPIYLAFVKNDQQLEEDLRAELRSISLERGVHLELPELDLIDKNLLSKPNVLFSPSQFIQNKFYNDSFIPLKISRVGINQWSIDGFFKSPAPMRENEIADFLAENLQRFLDKLLEVEPLAIGASGDRLILSVKGLGSFDDFKKTEEELGRIFAIKSKTYRFFDKTSIDFDLHLFYSASSLLKELRGSSSFIIKNYDAPNSTLYLELIN